jgi:ferredoxin, 2Fe-2S
MPSVTFLPAGTAAPGDVGESVFEIARRAGVPVTTACVGKATCGLCRVKIVAGEERLSPLNAAEKKHLGNVYFINKLRLSCQARLTSEGDVTVELPWTRSPTSAG